MVSCIQPKRQGPLQGRNDNLLLLLLKPHLVIREIIIEPIKVLYGYVIPRLSEEKIESWKRLLRLCMC
jgi:hypothetical protein